MEDRKSILHELYVFSEWKPEPEIVQKPDSILPENISVLWKWLRFFESKKNLLDSVTAYKQHQQKWQLALGDKGKVIAVLTDNILEIRTKRSDYATITARTTVSRDGYAQWRKLVWSPDCSFLALAYGNGVVSFFDLTAANLFNIPIECSRPGGIECTDTTHAVADIIFMPLRVKDNKWNYEVVIVTYDGRLRGYLVSQTEGCKLHHTFRFDGGVGALAYVPAHGLLYVAGQPRTLHKEPKSAIHAGITAWRILNDDPFYKLSAVTDQLESQLAVDRFQLYAPFLSNKNLAFIMNMAVSPDSSKLVCIHCNGDVSVWRLPLLGLMVRRPLSEQPQHDLDSPLVVDSKKHNLMYHPADANWWSDEELILSCFSGAVTVCDIDNMVNILGKGPEFMQGVPKVSAAHEGAFMVLECESKVLPARKSHSDESMEVVRVNDVAEDSVLERTRELVKSVLYAFLDLESLQPKPRRITVVSRVYRLLGVKSTTPLELFTRKIESGNYKEALSLAHEFDLDCDLVYQQQWRKTHVSSSAIKKYLSKVSKKIWTVHQCVDRLPETLPAAEELLKFGLKLTNEEILKEINKNRSEDVISDLEAVTLEDLNAYTSELLRCRHVMLFYRERLRLYEAILKCEKSTYVKDEYDRLRSNNLSHTAAELAKEGRIAALACLWPHVASVPTQLSILDKLPETINPHHYEHLLPTVLVDVEKQEPAPVSCDHDEDWCRKSMFRSIWSSNWSEDSSPESQSPSTNEAIAKWYSRRARQIEELSGLVSHAVALVTLAHQRAGVQTLPVMFHLQTLDILLYDVNVDEVNLCKLEQMSMLEVCTLLMSKTTDVTFVSDLKQFVVPYLKRYEEFTSGCQVWLKGLIDYLESISRQDLRFILKTLESTNEFDLDVRTHLEIVEKCLYAYEVTDNMHMANLLLATIPKESDDSISASELAQRRGELDKLLHACTILNKHNAAVTLSELKEMHTNEHQVQMLLTRMSRNMALREPEAEVYHWDQLLDHITELQSTVFTCVSKELCYETYALSLLTSGSEVVIKLAEDIMEQDSYSRRCTTPLVPHARAVVLVVEAAQEYINSAGGLDDPALHLAKCCMSIIKEGNEEMQEELDLLAAVALLDSFGVPVLPIQVRLSMNRITLIECCLKMDPNAYLASDKLLKLANLLKVSGDDEKKREGLVMHLVCAEAWRAGGGAACAAAAAAARRLVALRHAPAAALLREVAGEGGNLPRHERRQLLGAALAHVEPCHLHHMLADRLSLEVEGIQQEIGDKVTIMKEYEKHTPHQERSESTDDEFSDAVTTPVIERKDLVEPKLPNKKPLFNYLMDTWQNKFVLGNASSRQSSAESMDLSVQLPEFYRGLYPEYSTSDAHYRYDRFAMTERAPGGEAPALARPALQCYYSLASIGRVDLRLESDLVRRCSEEVMYWDSALGVACTLRALRSPEHASSMLGAPLGRTARALALYALLIKCNALALNDNVFLTRPIEMARLTLKNSTATSEQMELVRLCLDKLTNMVECDKLRALGYSVNGLLFNADEDYRTEVIYRMAKSSDKSHVDVAMKLASKYGLDLLSLWIQHARTLVMDPDCLPAAELTKALANEDMLVVFRKDKQEAMRCIKEEIWEHVPGRAHAALVHCLSLMRLVDERSAIAAVSALEHIRLLKKMKATSQELDYKLLLSQPTSEDFCAHLLEIIKPENVGIVMKFLRSLRTPFKIPVSVNALYTMWLTKIFFSVSPSGASSKKWMQQYRQCASYFSKLGGEDLLQFVRNTCFSAEAVDRVPAGTRNLMIMQAVDYCQQEQENDLKLVKNETSWAQVGQELTRWGRFLENYHSPTVQGIKDGCHLTQQDVWPEVEMCQGSEERALPALARLVMKSRGRAAALASLLHCLSLRLDLAALYRQILDHHIHTAQDVETLVDRFILHFKDANLSEALLEDVMKKVTEYGLPPHKQIGLLSLSQKSQMQDGDDLSKVINFTVDLFKTEWADNDYAKDLTEAELEDAEGRRRVFMQFLSLADTLQRKKALVDVLNCWPVDSTCGKRSLQCEYIHLLLVKSTDHKESLLLIRLLLRKPNLTDDEMKWLLTVVRGEGFINLLWTILLSDTDALIDDIPKYIQQYKETMQNVDVDEELAVELLDKGLLTKIVSTPLYTPVITYLMTNEGSDEGVGRKYDINWAVAELQRAGLLAEAGHLRLMASGVPSALRTFTQSIRYCTSFFKQ